MRLRTLVVGAATGVAVLGACDSGPSDDERTAAALCEELRAHDDRLVDLVNASVAGIAQLPEADRAAAIAGGFEDVTVAVEAWQRRIETLELGDVDEVDELRSQLLVGAERALDELARRQETLRSGPIPDREVQGAVGGWFNSVEKVMSVSEPEIFRFERREFKQAFLDEPTCRHVVQPFVNE